MGRNGKGKALFVLMGCLFMGWVEPTPALESTLAEVTAFVNLRTSPTTDGEILTVLPKGSKVRVIAQNGTWYEVVPEDDRFPESGWVYGKYTKKISEEQGSTAFPSNGAEANVAGPLSVDEASSVTDGTELGASEKKMGDYPSTGEHPLVAEPIRDEASCSVEKTAGLDPYYKIRVLLRLLVRLSCVVLSCLALLFSYKALHVAKLSARMMMRLERKFHRLDGKETGSREVRTETREDGVSGGHAS